MHEAHKDSWDITALDIYIEREELKVNIFLKFGHGFVIIYIVVFITNLMNLSSRG